MQTSCKQNKNIGFSDFFVGVKVSLSWTDRSNIFRVYILSMDQREHYKRYMQPYQPT